MPRIRIGGAGGGRNVRRLTILGGYTVILIFNQATQVQANSAWSYLEPWMGEISTIAVVTDTAREVRASRPC